jgi:hypothetical protein
MPISGAAKHKELVRVIEDALAATGTAIAVTDLRDGSYETDGRAFMGLKRDAQDIKTRCSTPSASTADRLHELKALRESGLITENEYQIKRRELLDRM